MDLDLKCRRYETAMRQLVFFFTGYYQDVNLHNEFVEIGSFVCTSFLPLIEPSADSETLSMVYYFTFKFV
jgi:hypothetical protein